MDQFVCPFELTPDKYAFVYGVILSDFMNNMLKLIL